MTVTIPFRVAKRGGRKEVQLPPDANNRSPDYTLIKALARAYRWRQILEDGEMGAIDPITPVWAEQRAQLGYESG